MKSIIFALLFMPSLCSAASRGSGAIEWILNSGKAYLLGMENLGSQAKTATMIIQYYEVAK